MRTLLLVLGLAALTGCDYRVPLTTGPTADADAAPAGLWKKTGPGRGAERLLVLPMNARELLVAYPAGKQDAMYAVASFGACAGRRLVQLRWFGTGGGALPDDDRVYQFAVYEIGEDELRVRLLNPDVVDKDVASTAGLIEAIEANARRPDLFREPMVFRKAGGRAARDGDEDKRESAPSE